MVSSVLQSHPKQTSAETLLQIRHTCVYVLAMAVQTIYPETKVTIGPWTDTGFYYDFVREASSEENRPTSFTPDDLTQIKTEMRRIINANLLIIWEGVDREQIRAEGDCGNVPRFRWISMQKWKKFRWLPSLGSRKLSNKP